MTAHHLSTTLVNNDESIVKKTSTIALLPLQRISTTNLFATEFLCFILQSHQWQSQRTQIKIQTFIVAIYIKSTCTSEQCDESTTPVIKYSLVHKVQLNDKQCLVKGFRRRHAYFFAILILWPMQIIAQYVVVIL